MCSSKAMACGPWSWLKECVCVELWLIWKEGFQKSVGLWGVGRTRWVALFTVTSFSRVRQWLGGET